jgi:putative oxidoreductase
VKINDLRVLLFKKFCIKKENIMNIVLWVLQGLLGLAFIFAGTMKTVMPLEKLGKQMTFVNSFSPTMVRFIGIAEVLGGVGLILPAATGILPWLTPVAASGLAIIMVGAAVYHARRHGEFPNVIVNLVLLLLAVGIIVGRFALVPSYS